MTTFLICISIYIILGLIASIIAIFKEPLLLYVWWLLPVGIIIWPWLLYAAFTPSPGRWI